MVCLLAYYLKATSPTADKIPDAQNINKQGQLISQSSLLF
jgi:hypothetical protein